MFLILSWLCWPWNQWGQKYSVCSPMPHSDGVFGKYTLNKSVYNFKVEKAFSGNLVLPDDFKDKKKKEILKEEKQQPMVTLASRSKPWLWPRFPHTWYRAFSILPSEGKQRNLPDTFQITHGELSEWQVQPSDLDAGSVQLYLPFNLFALRTREASSIKWVPSPLKWNLNKWSGILMLHAVMEQRKRKPGMRQGGLWRVTLVKCFSETTVIIL